MKQLDRLILKEIFGPWIFGIGLFTALLMAGTYLNKIADYVVQGVPGGTILQLSGLLFPAILVKTFTMAMLLAGLLGFGRLSSDSEIVALRAGGASIVRIVRPVMLFSVGITLLTFLFNEAIVPSAANQAKAIITDIANRTKDSDGVAVSFPVSKQYYVVARSMTGNVMRQVTLIAYNREGDISHYLEAPQMEFDRTNGWWHVVGETKLIDAKGRYQIETEEAWPEITRSPTEIIRLSSNDPDLLSMAEVRREIERGYADGATSVKRIHNMEYWYWNKISVPLAAFVFGTLGAVLGIRNHRTGTAAGFALAVAIIFGYVTLGNFMNVGAQEGLMPPWLASFAPVALGFVASVIIMSKRNA
jgi:lipopolysaccharide export system permease protein